METTGPPHGHGASHGLPASEPAGRERQGAPWPDVKSNASVQVQGMTLWFWKLDLPVSAGSLSARANGLCFTSAESLEKQGSFLRRDGTTAH